MQKQRFLALDVMRGLTLALMILVNTPGSWSHVYPPLLHADWHGVTPTDFIFPFFLFMVGAAMVFAGKSLATLSVSARAMKIVRRTLLIFLIGVLLNWFPFTQSLAELRIPGVLQRIALAYFFAAWIVLYVPRLWRYLLIAILLFGYWALLLTVPDPYGLETSLVRQLDLALLGENHLWQGKGLVFDPEGVLSTLPSIASVLFGYEVTRFLMESSNRSRAQRQLLGAGLILSIAGILWHGIFPLNKYLWTSSFVLLTSGVAILVLLALARLESLPILRKPFAAFQMLGQNPLFIYALSILWANSLWRIPVANTSAYEVGFEFLSRFASPMNASLIFALLNVALLWLVAWWLDRRKIVIAL